MTSAQKWWLAASGVICLLLLYALSSVLRPFLIAAFLAYLGNPLVERLQRWGVSRTLAVFIIFAIGITSVTLLALILVPLLAEQIDMAMDKLPLAIEWAQTSGLPWVMQHLQNDLHINVANLKTTLLHGMRDNQDAIAQVAKKISQSGLSLLSGIIDIILIPVVAFYLLRDWHQMVPGMRAMLPRCIEPTVTRLTIIYNEILSAFVRGQLFIMFVLAGYYAIGLWIIGLQMALLIGLLAGLLSIIPYLGFAAGIVAAALAAYLQFHTWMPVVYALLVFGIGHVLEGMILTPLLVGDKTGLHPVAVIFAILAGGHFFGLVGALVAVPVAAGIMVLLRYGMERYLTSSFYLRA
jgi:predicted PurR-regulated permease PerM